MFSREKHSKKPKSNQEENKNASIVNLKMYNLSRLKSLVAAFVTDAADHEQLETSLSLL